MFGRDGFFIRERFGSTDDHWYGIYFTTHFLTQATAMLSTAYIRIQNVASPNDAKIQGLTLNINL